MKNRELEKDCSYNKRGGNHSVNILEPNLLRHVAHLAPVKLPFWTRLLLKLPCPRVPSVFEKWSGLFAVAGSLVFLVFLYFFEMWLGFNVALWTVIVPLRWLIVLTVPLVTFIFWLRIQLERFIATLKLYYQIELHR